MRLGSGAAVDVLSRDPLLLQVDGFLSREEAAALCAFARGLGFTPSEILQSAMGHHGDPAQWKRSLHRTSSSVACDTACKASDATIAVVLERASELTRLGPEHSELQFLHYEEGQYYKTHHDYLGGSEALLAGPRALSLLVYLSDVEGGGETSFPALGLSVVPRAGRLLLWPDVRDAEPLVKDERTRHQALPLAGGEKLAANLWYYHRSLDEASRLGCLG